MQKLIMFVNKYKCKYNYKAVLKQFFKMVEDKNLQKQIDIQSRLKI